MLCLLPESHWHIIKMSPVNALSLGRVTLAHYQDGTGQCSVSCQSHIGTLTRCHTSMLCLLAESQWHIIKMSPVNALSLGRVTLAHYQDVTRQCSVSWQSHIGTLSICHTSMLCLLAESHWHITKMSQVNALSLGRVTLAHYQDVTGQCSVSWQSHIVTSSDVTVHSSFSCQSYSGTFSISSQLMPCLLPESHWHIIKMSQSNALSLPRVTLAHYQDVTGQCLELLRCLLPESHWHILK